MRNSSDATRLRKSLEGKSEETFRLFLKTQTMVRTQGTSKDTLSFPKQAQRNKTFQASMVFIFNWINESWNFVGREWRRLALNTWVGHLVYCVVSMFRRFWELPVASRLQLLRHDGSKHLLRSYTTHNSRSVTTRASSNMNISKEMIFFYYFYQITYFQKWEELFDPLTTK